MTDTNVKSLDDPEAELFIVTLASSIHRSFLQMEPDPAARAKLWQRLLSEAGMFKAACETLAHFKEPL